MEVAGYNQRDDFSRTGKYRIEKQKVVDVSRYNYDGDNEKRRNLIDKEQECIEIEKKILEDNKNQKGESWRSTVFKSWIRTHMMGKARKMKIKKNKVREQETTQRKR